MQMVDPGNNFLNNAATPSSEADAWLPFQREINSLLDPTSEAMNRLRMAR